MPDFGEMAPHLDGDLYVMGDQLNKSSYLEALRRIECSCDQLCAVYKQCCDDFLTHCPTAAAAAEAMIGRDLMEAPATCQHGVFMVEDCPAGKEDKLEVTSGKPLTAVEEYRFVSLPRVPQM